MNYILAALLMFSSTLWQDDPGFGGKPEEHQKESKKYLSTLTWGNNLPAEEVVDTTFEYGGKTAKIRIVPLVGSNVISWQEALGIGTPGGNGHFVAKIYNLEDKEVPPLGLKKGGTGYLWIGELKGANGERGAAIYSVKKDSTIENNPKKLSLRGYCKGQHQYSAVRLTDGDKCDGEYSEMSPKSSQAGHSMYFLASSRTKTPAIRAFGRTGLWIACAGGCCEVSIQ